MKNFITITLYISIFFSVHANAQESKNYCDGWEEGYEAGYTYSNSIQGKMKPIFITPICPIAGIGYDTYQDGYNIGVHQGEMDFKKR